MNEIILILGSPNKFSDQRESSSFFNSIVSKIILPFIKDTTNATENSYQDIFE